MASPAIYSDKEVTVDAIPEALESRKPLWVDIDSSDKAQSELLKNVFHFHPLAIDDTEYPNNRVKVDEYDGYIFITIRVVRLNSETSEDPFDIDTANLYIFLSEHYLVTVHEGSSAAIDDVSNVIKQNPDILARGVSYVAHMILDRAIDAYFPILDQIDDFIDSIEDKVFGRFDQSSIHEIFQVKRMVLTLRRYLSPQRDVFNILTNRPSAYIPHEVQLYFRDIYDHMLHLNDSLDASRDLLSGTMESYLSQISNKLGNITKGLSVIATISIPFVVISGMWGMNFDVIPMSGVKNGFWLMVLIQLLLGILLLVILRWWRLM